MARGQANTLYRDMLLQALQAPSLCFLLLAVVNTASTSEDSCVHVCNSGQHPPPLFWDCGRGEMRLSREEGAPLKDYLDKAIRTGEKNETIDGGFYSNSYRCDVHKGVIF